MFVPPGGFRSVQLPRLRTQRDHERCNNGESCVPYRRPFEVPGEKGDRLHFFHRFFLYQCKTPLSYEKRGCLKSDHVTLLIDELEGCWYVILNIHLNFKRKYD
jgi:hypothetical protein